MRYVIRQAMLRNLYCVNPHTGVVDWSPRNATLWIDRGDAENICYKLSRENPGLLLEIVEYSPHVVPFRVDRS